MPNGQQGNFIIKIDEAFDDNSTFTGTPAFLGVVPGFLHIVGALEQALAFA
ncbi:hypothetical protein D3C84_1279120 [compost metagenome]